jgi:hypothetical protein
MRLLLALGLVVVAASASATELLPLLPLPPGVPDHPTPGTPEAGGMRYAYPHVLDRYGRYGFMDWCRDWGAACGKPAAEAFCKKVDSGARPHAAGFAPWNDAGHYSGTVIISTGDPCELPRCSSFTYVICKK